MEEKKKNKKVIILTVIAVLVLVALIIGATYAYFLVGTNNSFGTRTIKTSAEEIGSVALTQGSNLTLDLTAFDMMNKGEDVTYYASANGKTTTPTTENIGVATVTGAGTYSCSYSLKMDDNENSMYDVFYSNFGDSVSAGDGITLMINETRYDFDSGNLFPKTISGTMSGLTSSNPGYITAQLRVINKKSVDQSVLAGTSLTITFTIESFECEAQEVPTLASYILENPTAGLNTTLQGGLYRYQGTSDEVDNYVCFGVSNHVDCVSDILKYMYRIIGITESGQIKLMKMTSIGSYDWYNNDSEEDIKWPESDLYKGLNGIDGGAYTNIFVNSSDYTYMATTSSWYNKIADTSWKYGDTQSNGNYDGDAMYAIEDAWTDTTTAKIGLKKISDYYYAYEGGSPGNAQNAEKSWIRTFATSNPEYLMTRYGQVLGDYAAWVLIPNSGPGGDNLYLTDSADVFPVFYLNSNVKYISGTGDSSAPFIIG